MQIVDLGVFLFTHCVSLHIVEMFAALLHMAEMSF